MTLTELRQSIPLSINELARMARVDDQTIRNAEEGKRISTRIARQIAEALTETLKKPINATEIDGLNIRL